MIRNYLHLRRILIDFQWIWGVFSVITRDVALDVGRIEYSYPYADGYK